MRWAGLVGLLAVFGAVCPSASAQVPSRVCAQPAGVVNGGFEQPDVGQFFSYTESQVPGWETTSPDGRVEIWQTGYLGVPSAVGSQHAELVANVAGDLYQDVITVPGVTYGWAISHRGRSGADTMRIKIGPPGGAADTTRLVSTGTAGWRQVTGRYVTPAGQTVTRFALEPVVSAGNPARTSGNFLDAFAVARAACQVTVTKQLSPVVDQGRFDLLVDDLTADGRRRGRRHRQRARAHLERAGVRARDGRAGLGGLRDVDPLPGRGQRRAGRRGGRLHRHRPVRRTPGRRLRRGATGARPPWRPS